MMAHIKGSRTINASITPQQWESWHTPSNSKQFEQLPDYDFQALWTLAQTRFGLKMPKHGEVSFTFSNNKVIDAKVRAVDVK